MRKLIVLFAMALMTSLMAYGTGAFTTVTVERSTDINVVNDPDALLSLTAYGPYASYNSNGELVIDPPAANMNASIDYGKVLTITNNGTKNLKVTIYQYLGGNDVTLTSPVLFSTNANGNPNDMHAVWNTNINSGSTIDVYLKVYTDLQEYPCEFGKVVDRIRISATS